MSPLSVFGYAYQTIASLFNPSISQVYAADQHAYYNLVLHSPRFLLYRGAETYVTFSLFAFGGQQTKQVDVSAQQTKQIKVQLVQKGWRAGLFGWNLASYLGAATKKGWDITPKEIASWHDSDNQLDADVDDQEPIHEQADADAATTSSSEALLTSPKTKHIGTRRKQQIETQLETQIQTSIGTDPSYKAKLIGTYKCRIPVATGDGYFRLWVTLPSSPSSSLIRSNSIQIASHTFRLFSFSLSSASPRGATLLPLPTLAPELVIRSLSLVFSSFLFATFPLAVVMENILPKWISRRFMRWVYYKSGADQKKQQLIRDYKIDEKVGKAKIAIQKVPFATAGVRTAWDLENDQARGQAGWMYVW